MGSSQGFPDFFVIGAPRCGTTALCRYLARHPKICFSRPKETHYFTRLDHTPSAQELEQNYLSVFFGHRTDEHVSVAEGSVSYLYFPGVIERILEIRPDARFIVMVRNPLTMLPSYHQRMRFLLQEDQPDLRIAWDLQEVRYGGQHIPPYCLDPRLLLYREALHLGAQVERLFKLAGRQQSHVIVFDDLKSDALSVYRSVLDFLDVEYDGQTNFERRYSSQMYRFEWLQRLFVLPLKQNDKILDTLQRRRRKYRPDGSKKKGLIKRLTDFNKRAAPPQPLTPEMKKIVCESLESDVAKLSELLERDLSHWLTGKTNQETA